MKRRILGWIGGAVVVSAMFVTAIFLVPRWVQSRHAALEAVPSEPSLPLGKLAPGLPNALELPDDVVERLGIQVVGASPQVPPEMLHLSGTLTLDASRYTAIRSRFPGEITEIPNRPETDRPAVAGDTVRKGELLAVVWSSELGDKKSELVDALSRLRLDNVTLQRLKSVAGSGAVSGRTVLDAERAVEADRIAVDRATRTLQTWRVPDEDIEAVRQTATRIGQDESAENGDLVEQWSRVELRAPFDGVILERNLSPGAVIGTVDQLVKIGDLSRLRVVAYAYEEQLPQLDGLPDDAHIWQISIPAFPELPPVTSRFDHVGDLIDPAQHTALVMGWIDNPQGRLRVGQFVRASVAIPPPGKELVIPASALVERGADKVVFVRPEATQNVYQLRHVKLGRRLPDAVTIQDDGANALRPEDEVVTVGAVEMLAALIDLQAANSSPEQTRQAESAEEAVQR